MAKVASPWEKESKEASGIPGGAKVKILGPRGSIHIGKTAKAVRDGFTEAYSDIEPDFGKTVLVEIPGWGHIWFRPSCLEVLPS